MKLCSKCGLEKKRSEFYRDQSRKDKLCYWCKSCKKEYWESEAGKEAHRRSSIKYREIHPDRTKAHMLVLTARRNGSLKKKPCPCGETKVGGHHEDYSKPLDVDWLCTKCHVKLRQKK